MHLPASRGTPSIPPTPALAPHPRSRGRTLSAILAALTLASSLLPVLALPAAAAPLPQSADLQVFLDDFEGAFPGANWLVNDSNPINGTDMWGSSGARRYAGNGSAWAAAQGTQTLFWNATGNATTDPFNETFENALAYNASWTASDNDANEGDDYWGLNGFRYHNGTQSLYCAEVGYNNYASDWNNATHLYDNMMDAYVWRTVNLSRLASINATEADLQFWYFLASDNGYDFLDVVYDAGAGPVVTASFTGDSGGWTFGNASIPAAATRIGFRFLSDSGGVLEGAYVDDLVLRATHNEPNQALRIYDVQMNATMTRAVDVSPYASALVEYRYYLDSLSPNDTLSVMYLSGGVWSYADTRSGTSGGWQQSTAAIPVNTTRVGFRFVSGAVGHREGAYIDNVRVVGHVNNILCGATVSPLIGFEGLTQFTYTTSTLAQGLPPYGFAWNMSGTLASTQNTSRIYPTVGTFTTNLTVSDAALQVCVASAPAVTVVHDTTGVAISPTGVSVVEGQNVSFSGLDRRSHPWPLNWNLTPPSCGVLNASSGVSVTLNASSNAGGSACRLTGSFGAVNATANISVLHNLSVIRLNVPTTEVVEGGTLAFNATDANGHPLNFIWSSSCGSLSFYVGPATVFRALDNGGKVCLVAAALNGTVAVANVTVLPDTSSITITPTFSLLTEGQSIVLGATNTFAHAINVSWTLSTPACGEMLSVSGNSTVFHSSTDSGGRSCVVSAAVGSATAAATVNITHDVSVLTLDIDKDLLAEGETTQLSFRDFFGHPYSAAWSVSPRPCGTLSPLSGGIVNFTAASEAAGLECTVTASVNAQAWRLNLSVVHAGPASVAVDPASASVVGGAATLLGASVLDAYGHILPSESIEWDSACAALSSESGVVTTATVPLTAGGTTCTVTASLADFTATITISVGYATPYSLTIEPSSASLSGGGKQEFRATVVDANGLPITGAIIAWTSTCGGLSSVSGYTVTLTAPSDLGGATCSVTASTAAGGAASTSSGSVTTGMSMLIPIAVAVPAALCAVLFLRWRKNRPPKFPDMLRGELPGDETPKFDVEIR